MYIISLYYIQSLLSWWSSGLIIELNPWLVMIRESIFSLSQDGKLQNSISKSQIWISSQQEEYLMRILCVMCNQTLIDIMVSWCSIVLDIPYWKWVFSVNYTFLPGDMFHRQDSLVPVVQIICDWYLFYGLWGYCHLFLKLTKALGNWVGRGRMCHFHFTIEDIKASGLWISSWFKAQLSLITALWAISSVGVTIIMSSMQRDISIPVSGSQCVKACLTHWWNIAE